MRKAAVAPKLCVDCRWYRAGLLLAHTCTHPNVRQHAPPRSLVTGDQPATPSTFCEPQRAYDDTRPFDGDVHATTCGASGRFWETVEAPSTRPVLAPTA